jgi:hypothetical protein
MERLVIWLDTEELGELMVSVCVEMHSSSLQIDVGALDVGLLSETFV